MADMQQIDVVIKRHKWGLTLRKDESSVARQAMQWNVQMVLGEERQDSVRYGDELWECKDL